MRLLLTRPEPDAQRTAAALRAHGHEMVLAPLLRIELEACAEVGPGPFGGVAITSANAVRALANHPRRGELTALPLYAVGPRSADAARAAGFTDVVSADKDVRALAQTIAEHHRGAGVPLLYLAAEDRAGDLAGALEAHGIAVRTIVAYRAVQAGVLPEPARRALGAGMIEGVLHFSRRTAEAYVAAAGAAGLLREALAPAHYCVSSQAGEPLAAAGARRILPAPSPEEEALLALMAAGSGEAP